LLISSLCLLNLPRVASCNIWIVFLQATDIFITFVPRQENERSCICVFRVSISSLSSIFLFDFGCVPKVWYFCFWIFILLLNC
jgi:hypothetical protein